MYQYNIIGFKILQRMMITTNRLVSGPINPCRLYHILRSCIQSEKIEKLGASHINTKTNIVSHQVPKGLPKLPQWTFFFLFDFLLFYIIFYFPSNTKLISPLSPSDSFSAMQLRQKKITLMYGIPSNTLTIGFATSTHFASVLCIKINQVWKLYLYL